MYLLAICNGTIKRMIGKEKLHVGAPKLNYETTLKE
jgi:hypothetical protein